MDNEPSWKTVIIIALILGAIVLTLSIETYNKNRSRGIHAAPSKQTTYLEGEACIINMPFDRGINELSRDFAWCIETHASRSGYIENYIYPEHE